MLSLLASRSYRPKSFKDLCTHFRLRPFEKKHFKSILRDLTKNSRIEKLNRKYQLSTEKQSLQGTLEITRQGFGFVVPKDGSKDVFIPQRFIRGYMHGDEVVVSILSESHDGKKREGKIEKAIKKPGSDLILGLVRHRHRGPSFLEPLWQSSPYTIFLTKDSALQKNKKLIIQAKIIKKNDRNRSFLAKPIEVLGELSNGSIDNELVILHQNIDAQFSENVIEETKKSVERGVEEPNSKRVDLRHLPFVTIDGEDAKDFDDAVCMDQEGHVWVAVADVSDYVRLQGDLDQTAASRGNSYYFPDRVVPMLPELLSNDLCSLRPLEDRQAMVLKMSFDGSKLTSSKIYNALIQSKARLSYDEVDQMLEQPQLCKRSTDIYEMIVKLRKLAEKLFSSRIANGGVDFDFHEVKTKLDQDGNVLGFSLRKRTASQNLIEELMLITNQSVAGILRKAKYPVVYRAHDTPDSEKLRSLVEVLKFHHILPEQWELPDDDRELIRKIQKDAKKSRKYEAFSTLLLRSMSQAHYTPEHKQHFALSFDTYAHFTSPIRRYADLINHRIAKAYLEKKPLDEHKLFPSSYGSLQNLSLHISQQERIAQKAERSISKIKGIRWFQDKVGQEREAMVCGITSKGLYLEIDPEKIEGFASNAQIYFRSMHYDDRYYCYKNSRTGEVVSYGDRFKVKISMADILSMRLDLVLLNKLEDT
ncbi:MAG: VacB/RNase II family 3'-5' exoribonuclease [Bdellovibrionales bacterium]|nr:VacB/RNase II family 3'-5' exoribonuclease [Bdellovibrionales bacterium]